jgi:hypothetical protein
MSDASSFEHAGVAAPTGETAERPAHGRRWTEARKAAFLRALEDTLCVSEAARGVGMSRQSAYKLRRRLAGQPFARAWDRAVADLRLEGPLPPVGGPPRCPMCGAEPAWPPLSREMRPW